MVSVILPLRIVQTFVYRQLFGLRSATRIKKESVTAFYGFVEECKSCNFSEIRKGKEIKFCHSGYSLF